MTLTLDTKLRIGIQTIHRRTEPATDAWQPRIDELVDLVELVDRSGLIRYGWAIMCRSRCPSSIRCCSSHRLRW